MSIQETLPTVATNLEKKSFRILYADDVPELRRLLEIFLGNEGHKIQTVADGRIAWQQLSDAPDAFDIVITDHHMPNMNGLEFITRVRRLPFIGKILVFSSELSEEVSNAYRALNVDIILPKPIFPNTLRSVIAAL